VKTELSNKEAEAYKTEKRSVADLLLTKYREQMRSKDFDAARATEEEVDKWHSDILVKMHQFRMQELIVRETKSKMKRIQLDECPEGLPKIPQKTKKDYTKMMSKDDRNRMKIAESLGMSVSDYVDDMKKFMSEQLKKRQQES